MIENDEFSGSVKQNLNEGAEKDKSIRPLLSNHLARAL